MYALRKSVFIKIIILMFVVTAGCFLVYSVILKKVDERYKNQQVGNNEVSISNADLSDDFVSLTPDNSNPQGDRKSVV